MLGKGPVLYGPEPLEPIPDISFGAVIYQQLLKKPKHQPALVTIASLNFGLLRLLLKSVGLLCSGPVIAYGISSSLRVDLYESLIDGDRYLSNIKWISEAVELHIFFKINSAILPNDWGTDGPELCNKCKPSIISMSMWPGAEVSIEDIIFLANADLLVLNISPVGYVNAGGNGDNGYSKHVSISIFLRSDIPNNRPKISRSIRIVVLTDCVHLVNSSRWFTKPPKCCRTRLG
ncbi:hypothetical protein WA026_017954 [Henosepilachna vigintioctopunctata]|uniref:Uncharacterized protein n=1 Tax=Henosepilachna vigintioctopunctata TaxID=420089 RepID=A0AAW1TM21_9CUCU